MNSKHVANPFSPNSSRNKPHEITLPPPSPFPFHAKAHRLVHGFCFLLRPPGVHRTELHPRVLNAGDQVTRLDRRAVAAKRTPPPQVGPFGIQSYRTSGSVLDSPTYITESPSSPFHVCRIFATPLTPLAPPQPQVVNLPTSHGVPSGQIPSGGPPALAIEAI